ncbi:hypothetical protein GFY24_30685 [Nocardia sp. SYP-A9097]|uniref:hypothetical protein n=1 Tax=Nocardia sp. SYP-A9097 TaxID=2663237 RepID=UPI00129B0AEC|nr:hypothetical protein [Nocardia sp. SYP-A9097]MRH91755.1 hypothetical protein [Nocardia sp. SYP-A9097]
MESVVGFAVAISPIALFAGIFALVVWRARRRGLGGSPMGPFQEMWDPGALRAQIAVEVQAEEAAPDPAPDDRVVPGIRIRKGAAGC